MNTAIPETEYQEILKEIESADNPVGIDAVHTHVLILYKLSLLEKRLDEWELLVEPEPEKKDKKAKSGKGKKEKKAKSGDLKKEKKTQKAKSPKGKKDKKS